MFYSIFLGLTVHWSSLPQASIEVHVGLLVLCSIPMHDCIVDFNIRKTLAFRARYAIKCSLISDPVTRATLQSLANFNYEEIKVVCQNGMLVIECLNIRIIFSCIWYSRSYPDTLVSKVLVGCLWNYLLTYWKFPMSQRWNYCWLLIIWSGALEADRLILGSNERTTLRVNIP